MAPLETGRSTRPTLAQLKDWQRRLADVCGEMEVVYGEPGPNYPPPLNMAVYIACYQAQLAIGDHIAAGTFGIPPREPAPVTGKGPSDAA